MLYPQRLPLDIQNSAFRDGLPVWGKEHVSKIEYYLNLNRFGRSQVCGTNLLSREVFVGLLGSAHQALGDDAKSLELFNVTYGLSREASNLCQALQLGRLSLTRQLAACAVA